MISIVTINHEYKEWNEKNPQLLTCNKDIKNLIQGNTVPQEVDTNKEIVFTYDVSFKIFCSKKVRQKDEHYHFDDEAYDKRRFLQGIITKQMTAIEEMVASEYN
uniref:Uncharacterized protein n=1 Tax=Cucumis melo TaxID=3656 RepID=A0A9I9ELY4_CUCME